MSRHAWGHALVSVHRTGAVLDAWFPAPALGEVPQTDESAELEAQLDKLASHDQARNVTTERRLVTADLDAAPVDTADVWLRLHLLSHRLVGEAGIRVPDIKDRLAGHGGQTDPAGGGGGEHVP